MHLFLGVYRKVPSASGSCVLRPEMETRNFMHQSTTEILSIAVYN